MSKRSIRVVRHRPDFEPVPPFKMLVRIGQQERCIRLGLPFEIETTMSLKEILEQAPVSEELLIPPPEVFAEMRAEMPNDPFVQAVSERLNNDPYIPAENELFSDTLASMTSEELDAPARLDTMHGRVLSEEEANQVKQELFPEGEPITGTNLTPEHFKAFNEPND